VFTLPGVFAVTQLRANRDDEIAANTSGRVSNKGLEGLAIAPDGNTLYGAMQSPLAQDGGTNGAFTRIVALDLATGLTRQLVYPLSNIGTASKPMASPPRTSPRSSKASPSARTSSCSRSARGTPMPPRSRVRTSPRIG
jgi:hypothetical protein